MHAVKKSTAQRLAVKLIDPATGNPILGVGWASVTASVEKSDGTIASVSIASSSDWGELASGVFVNSGNYFLLLTAGLTDTAGRLRICIAIAGYPGFVDLLIDVVTNLASDVYTALATDTADIEAAITAAASPLATSAALTTVGGNVTNIKAKTDNLPSDPADESLLEAAITAATSPLATSASLGSIATGVAASLAAIQSDTGALLKIGTGRWRMVSNQLIIYDTDDTTVLYTFDLKDAGGSPTMLNPYERVPA